MSATNALPSIQYFAENRQLDNVGNFLSFSDSIISLARGYGLEGYLDGSIPRPNANSAPALMAAGPNPGVGVLPISTSNNSTTPSSDEWELRNNRLAAIIFVNIKDPRGIGLTPILTAQEMWSRILAKFNPRTNAAQTIAKERFKALKFNEGDRFDDYFSNLERLKSEANEVGCNITDEDLTSQFLTNLPPTEAYSWIIQNYAGKTYPEIYSSLIEIQLRKDVVNNNAGSQRIVSSTALATSSNDGRPGLIRCSNCHRRGHPKSKCWAPGGDKEHEAPPWYKPPASKRSNAVAAATVPSGSNIAPPVALTNVIDLGSDTGDIEGRILPF